MNSCSGQSGDVWFVPVHLHPGTDSRWVCGQVREGLGCVCMALVGNDTRMESIHPLSRILKRSEFIWASNVPGEVLGWWMDVSRRLVPQENHSLDLGLAGTGSPG